LSRSWWSESFIFNTAVKRIRADARTAIAADEQMLEARDGMSLGIDLKEGNINDR
jgi:hypothetical protein